MKRIRRACCTVFGKPRAACAVPHEPRACARRRGGKRYAVQHRTPSRTFAPPPLPWESSRFRSTSADSSHTAFLFLGAPDFPPNNKDRSVLRRGVVGTQYSGRVQFMCSLRRTRARGGDESKGKGGDELVGTTNGRVLTANCVSMGMQCGLA